MELVIFLVMFCSFGNIEAVNITTASPGKLNQANFTGDLCRVQERIIAKPRTRINYFLKLNYSLDGSLFFPMKVENVEPKSKKQNGIEEKKHFVDLCLKEPDGLTLNQAKTYTTSDNPVVDFFFQVMEKTDNEETLRLLETSWKFSPNDTIKIVANLRDIRYGKGIRYHSFLCLYWLYQNHPLTLYNNLENFIKVGYWKDMLHLLITILFKGYVAEYLKFDDCIDPDYFKKSLSERKADNFKRGLIYFNKVAECLHEDNSNLSVIRNFTLRYAKERLESDVKYQTYHLKVAKLFADQLKKDLEFYNNNTLTKISLCSKWAPSLNGHFDKLSMIVTTISILLLNENNTILKDYAEITRNITDVEELKECQSAFAFKARKEYHLKYLLPLRKTLRVPEMYMHPGLWHELDYTRVASKCMMKNKKIFLAHDKERFEKFINKSETMSGATLKPIEIIQKITAERDETVREIYEKQWLSIVKSIKQGKDNLLKAALAICDVSGSMYSDNETPLNAALGLTLLTAQLSDHPWSSTCMTFSAEPQFHHITEEKLLDKLDSMKRMNWQMNTNIDAAFALILKIAVNNNLTRENLPRILFIFSDMEFDSSVDTDKTNFESIKSRFLEHNYTLPTVVFWKLNYYDTHSTPIQSRENNCILISGFSPKILSFIMKCQDVADLTPIKFLDHLIRLDAYKDFKVYD